jgi:cytidyltransferase-like protein
MAFNPDTIRQLPAEEKIRSFGEMGGLVRSLGNAGLTVVLAQGVFDIVHLGHVGYLRASRRVDPGNSIVIVGVENDESVRHNKGQARPINPLDDRLQLLTEFVSTGLVFAYEDAPNYNRPQDYIDRYRALAPAAIVVPTWDPHRDLKEWQAHEAGSNLALVEYRHLNSTTVMLQKIGYE